MFREKNNIPRLETLVVDWSSLRRAICWWTPSFFHFTVERSAKSNRTQNMLDRTHSELSIGVFFDQIDGTFKEQFSKDCIHHSGERFDAIYNVSFELHCNKHPKCTIDLIQ